MVVSNRRFGDFLFRHVAPKRVLPSPQSTPLVATDWCPNPHGPPRQYPCLDVTGCAELGCIRHHPRFKGITGPARVAAPGTNQQQRRKT